MLGWMLRRARHHHGRQDQIPAHKRERGSVAGVHSLTLYNLSTVRKTRAPVCGELLILAKSVIRHTWLIHRRKPSTTG